MGYKVYFENIIFTNISYDEDNGTLLYDGWLKFVISDNTVTVNKVGSES